MTLLLRRSSADGRLRMLDCELEGDIVLRVDKECGSS